MLHVVFWIQDPGPYIPLDLVYCANNQLIFCWHLSDMLPEWLAKNIQTQE